MTAIQRALILGAGGFLGSHLTRGLVRAGADVTGLVRDPDAGHVATRLSDVADDVRLVAGDTTDPDLLGRLVVGMDAVFPFAGHSGAARSMNEPLEDAAANAVGQLAVLEALRRHNPDARVVFPGSRLQYGRVRSVPVTEDHPQNPTSVYGLHKLTGEQYHMLYHQLFALPTCSLRISIPYGPHQDRADRAFGVVGTFLATASRGEAIQLYGGGAQLRDYVFVEDLVELCLTAATAPEAVGRAFNAGGPRPTSLRAMAEAVVDTVGTGRVVAAPWPALDAAVETGDYVSDLTRVSSVLGWRPTTDLDAGLAATWNALAPSIVDLRHAQVPT